MLTTTKFAKIGVETLARLINYRGSSTTHFVNPLLAQKRYNDCCSTHVCPNKEAIEREFYSSAPNYSLINGLCKSCRFLQLKPHKLEKNQDLGIVKSYNGKKYSFDDEKSFSKSEIKVFLLLHFFNIDNYAFTSNFSLNDIAELLNITTATAKNCLCNLYERNLIELSGYTPETKTLDDYDCFFARIPKYNDYFKKVYENGKGYINLSYDFMKLAAKLNTNELRCLIFSEICHYNNYEQGDSDSVVIEKEQFSTIFPKSYKFRLNKIIGSSANKLKDYATSDDLRFTKRKKNSNIILHIKKALNHFNNYSNLIIACKREVNSFVDLLNKFFAEFKPSKNSVVIKDGKAVLKTECFEKFKSFYDVTYLNDIEVAAPVYKLDKLVLSEKDSIDLANIAVNYSSDLVKKALVYIYNNKYNNDTVFNNFEHPEIGKLARVYCKQSLGF